MVGGLLTTGYIENKYIETAPAIATLGLVGGVLPGTVALVVSRQQPKSRPLSDTVVYSESNRYSSPEMLEGAIIQLATVDGTTISKSALNASATATLDLPPPGLNRNRESLLLTINGQRLSRLHPFQSADWREASLQQAIDEAAAEDREAVINRLDEMIRAMAANENQTSAVRSLQTIRDCLERWGASASRSVPDDFKWLLSHSTNGGAVGRCALVGMKRNRPVAAHRARREGQCRAAQTTMARQTRVLAAESYLSTLQQGVARGRDALVARMHRMVVDGDVSRAEQEWVDCVKGVLIEADDMLKGLGRAHYQGFAHEFQDRFDSRSEGVMSSITSPGESCAAWIRERLGSAALSPVNRYIAAVDQHHQWRCDD